MKAAINLDFGRDYLYAAQEAWENGNYLSWINLELGATCEIVYDCILAYDGAKLLSGAIIGFKSLFTSSSQDNPNIWNRVDTIENIEKFGTNLGKDVQLFLTKPDSIKGVDLATKEGIVQAEKILGLHEGDLSKSNILVKTTIDITNLTSRKPTVGTDLFIPGGYTSGGAPEIVIDALNIFQNPAVQSIEFIQK